MNSAMQRGRSGKQVAESPGDEKHHVPGLGRSAPGRTVPGGDDIQLGGFADETSSWSPGNEQE